MELLEELYPTAFQSPSLNIEAHQSSSSFLTGEMTYLVHIHVAPCRPGAALPSYTASAIASTMDHPEVVHVAVHPEAEPHPVIGVYLREATLELAEASARRIWRDAVSAQPRLADWELVHAEVPLIPSSEFFE
ncbi:hypothetical protein ABZ890_17880 [Streptomyces sp. NPDC046984]|uniref:hypothetical protein n=1 Tax=Streptomyces sp. NPDC046984 TaxID=3155138 RepID=UPI003404EF1E